MLRGAISIANSLPAHSDARKVASWERALKGMVIATGDGGVVKPYDAAPDNASQATPETWCATSPSLECLLEPSLPAVSLLAMLCRACASERPATLTTLVPSFIYLK